MSRQGLKAVLDSKSCRVLNCARVVDELGWRDVEPPPATLMFRTRLLNNAVLIKDVPPRHVEFLGSRQERLRRARVATNIFLPYDPLRPGEGGQMMFYGSREFDTAIQDLLDLRSAPVAAAYEADRARLELLDLLPNFSPYLLREHLQSASVAVEPTYFTMTPQDVAAIESFAADHYKHVAATLSQRGGLEPRSVTETLWQMQHEGRLEALAGLFQIPRGQARDTFFAWRGVVCFAFDYMRQRRGFTALQGWLEQERVEQANGTPGPLHRTVSNLANSVTALTKDVESRLGRYRRAFDNLFVSGAEWRGFYEFLAEAPDTFQRVGVGLARLAHVAEIWSGAVGRQRTPYVPPERKAQLYSLLEEHALSAA